MKIQLKTKDTSELLDQLGSLMNATVLHDYTECELKIPAKFGKGSIHSFEYGGISMLFFNCQFKEDLQIDFLKSKEQPLRIDYCVHGNFRHVFFEKKLSCEINKYAGCITSNPTQCRETFYYSAKKPLLISQLLINRKAYFHRVEDELPTLPQPLATAFSDLNSKDTFFYRSNFDMGIVDGIQAIEQTTEKGLVRSLFIESKMLEVFYLHIKQYEDDFIFPSKRSLIKKQDTEVILKARDILISDLTKNITIPNLAKRVGINQQKLKTVFKIVCNKTIATYLRDTRLEKGRQLLATGTMTVKEASEYVGYSNQSHFSKRFKEKYRMLPKEFITKTLASN